MGSICTVRVCIGLLSGLDLLFGLRGCRVYVGLFSGLDLLFGFRGCRGTSDLLFGLRGCRVHVGGSGGGSIRCVGLLVEAVEG